MAKVKVFELKNIINEQSKGSIESKDIQDFIEKKFGVKKTHSSGLEDNEVAAVKSHFMSSAKAVRTSAAADTAKQVQPKSDSTGVPNRPVQPSQQSTQSDTRNQSMGEQRPSGQGVVRQQTAGQSQQGQVRPGQMPAQPRPAGDGGQRPISQGQGQPRPAGDGGQRPISQGQGQPGQVRPGQMQPGQARPGQMQGNQRPIGDQSQRPAGQQGMRPPVQGQMQPGQMRPGQMPGQQRPAGDGSQRMINEGGQRQGGQQGIRQTGQGQSRMSQQGIQPRPGMQPGQTRPMGDQSQRPMSQSQMQGQSRTNQSQQGMQGQYRPAGEGNQMSTNRQQGLSGYNQSQQGYVRQPRPDGDDQAYNRQQGTRQSGYGQPQQDQYRQGQNNRQSGQGYTQSEQGSNQSRYQGQRYQGQNRQTGESSNRGMNQGDTREYNQNNQRPSYRQGNEGAQGQNRNSNYSRPDGSTQGNRPSGNYQGNRPSGNYQGNRPSENYQGNRPSGNYQGNRPSENYQGNRPSGNYQGNRPSENYQGNRPSGNYQGNRPSGNYQGNRPAGNTQGNRPGGYSQGNRPGGFSQGNRPAGGYNNRFGSEEFNKDEDTKPSYQKGQGNKRGPAGKGGERKNFDQQILEQKVAEKNDYSNKRKKDRIDKEKTFKDKVLKHDDVDINDSIIKKIVPKKGQFIQPKPIVEKEDEIKTIVLPEILTIKELAEKMKLQPSVLVKKLFLEGKMVSINQEITYEEAEEIALEYEIIAEKEVKVNEVEELLKEDEDATETLQKRPPVVCVMGHVDHGKTSLLDAIRETSVTAREAGGITQHIGAYVVEINGEEITFLDTPGHEAFTSMRMRGAQATDIAILVVAADDGVMPQTIEAISHAKAAGVQIIVAINKIDKPSANIERVKQELTEYELVAEDWGGDTIFVPVSAHTKEGIAQLLEMIILTSELAELKANPNRNARGLVIEAELDKGRGPVATILVQKGTLHVGDNIAVGSSFGKVRAMIDDKGRRLKEATPSTPVEILGLNEVPDVGEIFMATDSEKEARTIAEAYITQGKEKLILDTKARLSLDGLFSQIKAGNIKELNLIIKADVQGSVEAMKQSLLKLSNDEVAVRVIHGGVGAINESDVILASTSNAIIIGFNVKPDNAAHETAEREKIDIKLYRVIYNAIDDVEAAMKGMLDPIFEERIIGHAEIRQTFKASGVGTIAGSYVLDGKIIRGSKARIYRDKDMIYDGILASLKRFQDDVKEVATGYECGLVFDKFNDVKEGDKVELYIMAEVPR